MSVKFDQMPDAKMKPGDTPEMRQAIHLIEEYGRIAKRPIDCQLKLDKRTSYYPDSGTLNEDNKRAGAQRGMAALRAWLDQPRFED